MAYALTADVGVKLGPVMLETAFRHFLAGRNGDETKAKDEILYHEAFNIVKTFMQTSTKHTVEELQQFSNQRIPVPPWVHAPRVLIPMSCCNEAAQLLIKTLGGEEMCKRLVGGTKWWQVRGVQGVHGQWIAARKDWQESKRKRKEYEAKFKSRPPEEVDVSHEYQPEMDQMRCLLFAHGGGYFFGSIDQERYCMQRYARKMKGRVFAVGYRLAPQYPFPCALQDALAAYIYLIRPPPDAKHLPVPPSMIILGGSSAGGGLMIALLQLIRDSGLPLPAGAVLISPWCDLTHSFPSIHENTSTDVIPTTGLSFLKPSSLWPPPAEEDSHKVVRDGLKARLKKLMYRDSSGRQSPAEEPLPASTLHQTEFATRSLRRIRHARSESSLGLPNDAKNRVAEDPHEPTDRIVVTVGGQHIDIDTQIHLYCSNKLIKHPLVSPVLSYLGGLPPMLFIAGDGEVLRDEIIFTAHKAARANQYPVSDEIKRLYPPLAEIDGKLESAKVHLQIYDDTCHVLPLFSFCTPAKFCYRAIATFCKQVVPDRPRRGSMPTSPPQSPVPTNAKPSTFESILAAAVVETPEQDKNLQLTARQDGPLSSIPLADSPPRSPSPAQLLPEPPQASAATNITVSEPDRPPPRRGATRATSLLRKLSLSGGTAQVRRSLSLGGERKSGEPRQDSGDVAGRRFEPTGHTYEPGLAGDPSVYDSIDGKNAFSVKNPICQRVSTTGVLRPLEEESKVTALCLPLTHVGVISEASAKRYIDARVAFDRRFAGAARGVKRQRSKLLSKSASKHEKRALAQLANAPSITAAAPISSFLVPASHMSPWYFDAEEEPPSSSLVARRDTAEARRLGMIADQSLSQEETRMSGNSLWSAVANFLSTSPEADSKKDKADPMQSEVALLTSPVVSTSASAEVLSAVDSTLDAVDGTREPRTGSTLKSFRSIFRRPTSTAPAAPAV